MANTLKQSGAGAKRGTICQGDALAGASVVMVSYWTGEVLWEAIEAVLSPDQEGMAELILVDNGNSPAVAAELARRAQRDPRLILVTGHGNVGFARACNLGASRARGRHLLLLNPDCRLAPGAIPALLSEAAALGDDWMLGCRVRNPDGSEQRGSRRELLTPRTALVEALRLDRLSPRHARPHRLNHHETPLPAGTVRVPAISGACMMLPAATFRSVGGLDEGYFLHVDDLDLCRRLHLAGVPVYFAPHVEATHHVGSSRASPVRIEWHKARGFLRYFRRHYGGPRWWPLLLPLAAAILARLGIRAVHAQARTAWGLLVRRVPDTPTGAGSEPRARRRTHPEGAGPDARPQGARSAAPPFASRGGKRNLRYPDGAQQGPGSSPAPSAASSASRSRYSP